MTRRPSVLLDTGPLVALLDRRDAFHGWAASELTTIEGRMLTCEAVVAEACHIVRRLPGGPESVLALVERAAIISFRLESELPAVTRLVKRYASVPMSLADACLVRMSELTPGATVLTLDSDFRVYRRNGRQAIPLRIAPGR
ncbi:MAG: PIN domain-containing protein [Myxococcota bacterium]|nr:PIN domain-containing protein [Myxococcota bacterium]